MLHYYKILSISLLLLVSCSKEGVNPIMKNNPCFECYYRESSGSTTWSPNVCDTELSNVYPIIIAAVRQNNYPMDTYTKIQVYTKVYTCRLKK